MLPIWAGIRKSKIRSRHVRWLVLMFGKEYERITSDLMESFVESYMVRPPFWTRSFDPILDSWTFDIFRLFCVAFQVKSGATEQIK